MEVFVLRIDYVLPVRFAHCIMVCVCCGCVVCVVVACMNWCFCVLSVGVVLYSVCCVLLYVFVVIMHVFVCVGSLVVAYLFGGVRC